jgi:polyhydroxyalkanoate synthesis regulator phasin
VYDEVDDFPLSTERAKEVRDDLMEERKAQLEATEQDRREDFHYYNFCEH